MHEDDYTGAPIEDGSDDLSHLVEIDLENYEMDEDETMTADENETVIYIGGAANGARSLEEAAEKLYRLADDMMIMSGEGWDLVDDVSNGYGTAVLFGEDGLDS